MRCWRLRVSVCWRSRLSGSAVSIIGPAGSSARSDTHQGTINGIRQVLAGVAGQNRPKVLAARDMTNDIASAPTPKFFTAQPASHALLQDGSTNRLIKSDASSGSADRWSRDVGARQRVLYRCRAASCDAPARRPSEGAGMTWGRSCMGASRRCDRSNRPLAL